MGLLSGKRFAEKGANVVLTDVNAEALEKAAKEITNTGGNCISVLTDVRDFDQITSACKITMEKFGSIDVLINCAGGASSRIFGVKQEFKDYPIDILDWGIDVNMKGPLYFTRAVIGQMISQKSGVLIYLGSITGEDGGGTRGTGTDYCMAKVSLMYGLTKSMAQYGAPHGIRACCVSPGPVLTRPAMANMKTMLGRAAEPSEIVDLIEYLVSDKAAFITGVNYFIDGGRNCMKI